MNNKEEVSWMHMGIRARGARSSMPCTHLGELPRTTLANDVVRQSESLELRLVGQSLRQDLGSFSIDVIRVKTQIDKFVFVDQCFV